MRFKVILIIALKNLLRKRGRALITILGLSIAIALVIIFVSLGYGLQKLVIDSFSSMEALRTIDITPEKSDIIRLDDTAVSDILDLEQVIEVLPVVELGARMTYNNSTTDVAVLGMEQAIFDKWTSIVLEEPNKLDGFSGNKIIVSRAALTLVGVPNTENVTGLSVDLDISTSVYSDGVSSLQDSFEIITTETNSSSPIVIIPLEYLTTNGLTRYSMVKAVTNSPETVQETRLVLEKMGYKTRTTQDTVDQIGDIFRIIRIGLAVFGIVAGVVATLGMFNTLTVSLMEKTREIGILKALGAQSKTILHLFLVEAGLMSFAGAIIGVLMGMGATQIIQIILSTLATMQGYNVAQLFAFPIQFLAVVFGITLVVGFLTGLYPARKASKINTLEALRYE
jgi:putative ABC transport system permease protein